MQFSQTALLTCSFHKLPYLLSPGLVRFPGVAWDARRLPVVDVPKNVHVAVMVDDVVNAFGQTFFADGTDPVLGLCQVQR